MMGVQSFLDKFWSPAVWLPPNVTWEDLEPTADRPYADYRHLVFPLPMAVAMWLLRCLLEKHVFSHIGTRLGIRRQNSRVPEPNAALEKVYSVTKRPSSKEMNGLCKQLDMTERKIDRWFRLRNAQDRPSTLVKFCESAWRCLYYSSSFLFGLCCLWDKPWLADIDDCWRDYPFQPVTGDCWWYYMVSLAFYWSLTISQFTDVHRKDFWQMFVHHLTTISLLSLSWVCNAHRIGTLVLLVHDCADILLELTKMAKYAGRQLACNLLFVLFALLWVATRVGVYPFWILHSTTIGAEEFVHMFPAYYIFNSLLFVLLFLHVIWTCIILKLACKFAFAGQVERDLRSSSEGTGEEEDFNSENCTKNSS
ncbi:ceramide synthase 5-like [Bacillus rossius redtenbacheri]|uniref:ceramide synthase 5-like n=1 Tax=Bacillus rossius redtenbacheri TaxID=93214 RepID=UPI002FDF06CE